MTIKFIFNMIYSEIDHLNRHDSFDGWVNGELDYENNENAYFEYELYIIKPVIDWCYENGIVDFKVKEGNFAMQPIFIFNHSEDAMAFKLRWWRKGCIILLR